MKNIAFAAVVLAVTTSCGPRGGAEPVAPAAPAEAQAVAPAGPAARQAFFGDLHIHTRYSFDAFIFNVRTTPDDAYKFARGEAIRHPAGFDIKLESGAIDFAAVTDHSEYLGVMPAVNDQTSKLYPLEIGKELRGETGLSRREAFQKLLPDMAAGKPHPDLYDQDVMRTAWSEMVAAAERNNEPGKFTTFIGYEYTSAPDIQNLHRNVIFRSGKAPELPFTALDSQNPEDLWRWLDQRRAEGIEALAIPHNSNGSNGQMFKLADWAGNPFDAGYADLRLRNEPIVEISQVKGTSETHPLNSPNDEWAGFQIFPLRIASLKKSDVPGSYVREALLHGIELEEKSGFNPFRFGFIGSSDTHVAGGPFEESNYWSKAGAMDGTAQQRGSVPIATGAPPAASGGQANPIVDADGNGYADVYYDLWGSAGLAGVWAEENTRESIYDAMRRKETFATSGPRILVRFFGGFTLPDGLAEDPDAVAKAYARGVPMGGDLLPPSGDADGGAAAPTFLLWALRDPKSAGLQRLQVVKGWVEDGEGQEKVYDVACSDGLTPDSTTHRCGDNGATVDTKTCAVTEGKGAGELRTVWTDPEFDATHRSFYYLRVIENPTCRWSTWDAIRAGVEPRQDVDPAIQERAWSSPIWYVPAGKGRRRRGRAVATASSSRPDRVPPRASSRLARRIFSSLPSHEEGEREVSTIPAKCVHVLLTLALLGAGAGAPIAAAPAGPAPGEELLDLSPWRGRVVLVDFWASWCIPCRRSFPWMQSMMSKHGAEGLVVVAVNVGESRTAADAFTEDFANDFQYRYDPEGKLADALGIDAMPSSILFDREGRPVFRHAGFDDQDRAEYEQQIVSLLAADAASSQPTLEIEPGRRSGVRPWQRGVLARESMRLDADLLTLAFDDHVYFSKEASSGGRSFGGGGCGCN